MLTVDSLAPYLVFKQVLCRIPTRGSGVPVAPSFDTPALSTATDPSSGGGNQRCSIVRGHSDPHLLPFKFGDVDGDRSTMDSQKG